MYQSSISNPLMSITAIQGHLLEVTAVGCYKLKDTEWISRQDPYVCLEYANTKFSTRTCTDGGKNPTFQEKFTISLIEGLRELNAVVWNSNTLTFDDFIGSAKIQLHKVLSEGYDDCSWPLQTKKGRHAGEVRLILHYANAKKSATSYAPSAPPYVAPYPPQVSMYSTPPPAAYGTPYPPPTNAFAALLPYGLYPTSPAAYPANPYPPQPTTYTSPYHQPSAYPPPPYPPPPHASSYYPPGPFPGIYPPPMY